MNENHFKSTKEVFDIVYSSLRDKKPLSIIRIGDGEIRAIEADIENPTTKNVYNKHIGYIPSNQILKEISDLIENAILKCDILGLPNKKHIEKGWGGIIEYVESIQEKPEWSDKNYCSMNIHYDLLNDNLLDNLLKDIDDVVLVTCRDLEDKMKIKYPNIKRIKRYDIPKQYRFEENKKIGIFYPDVYNKIIEDIKNTDYSGKLCLLGGGFIGKNIAVEFANSNGVCIDIGSVFDLWYGKITRGPGKGPNSYRTPLL